LPSDLQPELARAGIDWTVLVQGYPQSDTGNRWLFRQANATPFVAGVVAWADLQDADRCCQQLDELADETKFVGVRHIVQDEPDVQFLLRENVVVSLRELARRSIPYDMVVFPRHLPAVIETLQRVPDLRMVIDHIGKPDIAGGDTAEWAENMATIAQHPFVYCKLSGLATEADWNAWQAADLRPYVDRVIGWFGLDRLMYGSDWPVCLLATDYSRFWRVLRELLEDIGTEDQAKVFGDNAVSFYQLNVSGHAHIDQPTEEH
jgi:L-fuconolactonase